MRRRLFNFLTTLAPVLHAPDGHEAQLHPDGSRPLVGVLGARPMTDTIPATVNGGNRARRNWRKRWLLRRARHNFLARQREPRRNNRPWVRVDAYTRGSVKGTQERTVLTLPEHLDFEDNYEETTRHFALLRQAEYGYFRISKLRFDKIRRVSPAAALVLASEMDRWNQRLNGRLRADVKSWHADIKRLLSGMGYFELLQIRRPAAEAMGDPTFLRFIRGDERERDLGKLARQLRLEIEKIVGGSIKKLSLFEGLSEAITNVGQHAYGKAENGRHKQWWLSASYHKQQQKLVVMFYDQGQGIPQTLPTNWHSFEAVKALFGSWSDSEKIKAAMQYGRSSTFRAERGKGLQNLVEFAKAHSAGWLSIYSLRGLYRFVSTAADGESELRRDHQTSIGGTLIEWSVRL